MLCLPIWLRFKYITAFLLTLLLMTCPPLSGSDDKPEKKKIKTDLAKGYFVGKVQSVVEKKAHWTDGCKQPPVLDEKQTFNKHGFLVEEYSYGGAGVSWSKSVYTYNKNLLVSETESWMEDSTIEVTNFKYEFDKHGNKIKETHTDKDGKAERSFINKYDKFNNLLESKHTLLSKKENRVTSIGKYTYSKNGMVASESIAFSGVDYKTKRKYHYTKAGVLSFVVDTTEGRIKSRSLEYYNSRGWTIKEESFERDLKTKNTTLIEYKVDKVGNWIERTTYLLEKDGDKTIKKADRITYRTIKYFDQKK